MVLNLTSTKKQKNGEDEGSEGLLEVVEGSRRGTVEKEKGWGDYVT